MKNIINIPDDLISRDDVVLKTIKEASEQDFNYSSGLIFVKLKATGNDYTSIRRELQENEQSWGILEPLIESMKQELKRFAQQFEEFYLTKSDHKHFGNEGLSPLEINYMVNAALLRIKRMRCVLSPEFTKIEFQDKKTPNRYTMVKGYWFNDEGARKRSFSRSISNSEASFEDLISKIIKSHIKNAVVIEPDKSHGFRPDLLISDGIDRWAIEIKIKAKDSLIRTLVMLEMWKLYKQTYELIK